MPEPIEIPGVNIPVIPDELSMQEFIWNNLLRELQDSDPGIIAGYIVVGSLKRCVDLKQITKAEVEKIIDAPNIDIRTEDLTGIACMCIENAMVNHINGNSEAFERWLEIASFAATKIEPKNYTKTAVVWKEYVEELLKELSKLIEPGSRPHEILEELEAKANDINGEAHDLSRESF